MPNETRAMTVDELTERRIHLAEDTNEINMRDLWCKVYLQWSADGSPDGICGDRANQAVSSYIKAFDKPNIRPPDAQEETEV